MLHTAWYTDRHPKLMAARLSRAVTDIFDLMRPCIPAEDTGGVLIIQHGEHQHVTFVGRFEKYPPKACYRVANEKLRRTFIMNRRHGDISAWPSHDPDRKKFAGCILLGSNFGISFPGLSEYWDEVLLAVGAWVCGFYDEQQIERIRSISHNPHLISVLTCVRAALGNELA